MEEIRKFLDQFIAHSSPEAPIWNQEARLANQPICWSYIDGCMILAIQYMFNATQDENYLAFAETFIDYYIDEEGNPLGYDEGEYNCDAVNEGKVLFQLYAITKKSKYRKALDKLYRQVLLQPRTKEGSMWHKLLYPQQVWLDGLYMVQPFAIQYQLTFGNSKDVSDVIRQFKNVMESMKDPRTGLLYHGYDCTRTAFWAQPKTGCSANFWTRSLGWYAMALVDTLEILLSHEGYHQEKQQLQRYLTELIEAVIPYQDPKTSLFFQVTDKPKGEENYLETSGSAALSYVMLKASRLAILPSQYKKIGETILRALVKHKLVIKNGKFTLKDICLVAGLGGMPGKGNYKIRDGSYEYYISEPVVNDDAKGIGPFVYAYSEWLQLQRQ
ncbi:glycoside hydrolase family 88 protein [Enterococcus sp.]|uniref:glycoside hydrolase family 88/105 protein n=1 Tax=Enterococcus sp. TaxID=35783 RepID=UPI0025C0395B|nr:glycoside hydrolase family 88 protein [Enterococcus sp.]